MEQQNPRLYETDEEEIDLGEIAFLLLKNIWLLICCFIIGACSVFSVSSFLITPKYEATSMIYILSNSSSLADKIDLQLSKQLTVDFETLATTREVIEKVINNLQLDITYEDLKKNIEVENPSNTQILKITAKSTDPRLAKRIANTMANVTSERISEVMMTDKPTIGTSAVTPDKKASPSVAKNTVIGGLIGFLIAAAYLIINYIIDDTIKSMEDVEKYLELSVLSLIPVDDSVNKKTGKSKRKTAKKGKDSEGSASTSNKAAQTAESDAAKSVEKKHKQAEPGALVKKSHDTKAGNADDVVEIIDIFSGKESR